MKTKHDHNKKNKRSPYNEVNERNGLKPVKSKNGKSKNFSIYDNLDDDTDFEMDNYSLHDTDFEDNYYDDEDDY